jgi:hypothetical protein
MLSKMRLRARRAIRGAVDGFVATLPLTAVMFGAQRLGLLGRLPPSKITRHFLHRLGARPDSEFASVLTALNHLAFGAGAGALYGAVAPRTSVPVGAVPGIGYGLGVWLASYQGWVPMAGIMPPASRDHRLGRPSTMAIAHVVFGAVLGMLTARRRLAGR